MKPTLPTNSPTNHQPNFPLTDYNYRSAVEASRAGIKKVAFAGDTRGFWKQSTDFIGIEGKLYYATELLLFGVIVALSGLQVTTMLVAVGRMLRGY